MQKKYDVQKENTDKWIRGQQRKLREQYKKKNNANNLLTSNEGLTLFF